MAMVAHTPAPPWRCERGSGCTTAGGQGFGRLGECDFEMASAYGWLRIAEAHGPCVTASPLRWP